MSPNLREEGYINFGADLVYFGVAVGDGVILSFLHNILRSSGWILTKFSSIYNWDIKMKRLDFCNQDLVFKVTAVGLGVDICFL